MSRSLLRLYREILKTAAVFPSKNRASIITEIKSEFRAARGETDAAVIEKKILLAKDGLDRMRVFTGASRHTRVRDAIVGLAAFVSNPRPDATPAGRKSDVAPPVQFRRLACDLRVPCLACGGHSARSAVMRRSSAYCTRIQP